MPKTSYAVATELSREMRLGLSNQELEALAALLDGMGVERGSKELYAGGREAVRREMDRAAA